MSIVSRSRILRRAEQIIGENGWWNGEGPFPHDSNSKKCLVMAVTNAALTITGDRHDGNYALDMCRKVTDRGGLATWNDTHTEAQVRDLLLQAAEYADAEDIKSASCGVNECLESCNV